MGRHTERERTIGRVAFGVTLMLVGSLLTLHETGLLRIGSIHQLWPLFLIVPGLVKLTLPEARRGGVFLVGIGAAFLATTYNLVTFRQVWPVFIVVVGVSMVWRAVGRERQAAGSEGQE